jgi:hypothetical protein
MHTHDHDALARESLRPRSRLDGVQSDAALFRAAVAGRPDVLGGAGMLRLQRVVGNEAVQRLAEGANPVAPVLGGGGMPFGGPVRADMERRFGTDFSDVRIHTGDDAHASAKAVGAHAYTVGSNVVFQRGSYAPESPAGRTMLAHELTHVVQQRSGPVDGTPTEGGIRVSDPGDRFEREAAANAERIVAMSPPVAAAREPAAPTAATAPAVQRDADDEQVQGSFEPGAAVQRDEEEREEG